MLFLYLILLLLFVEMLQMLSSKKDLNFVGYTYKNFEIVNDYQVPGMGTSLFSLFTATSCFMFIYFFIFYFFSSSLFFSCSLSFFMRYFAT